jgi:hypothetical protein
MLYLSNNKINGFCSICTRAIIRFSDVIVIGLVGRPPRAFYAAVRSIDWEGRPAKNILTKLLSKKLSIHSEY